MYTYMEANRLVCLLKQEKGSGMSALPPKRAFWRSLIFGIGAGAIFGITVLAIRLIYPTQSSGISAKNTLAFLALLVIQATALRRLGGTPGFGSLILAFLVAAASVWLCFKTADNAPQAVLYASFFAPFTTLSAYYWANLSTRNHHGE